MFSILLPFPVSYVFGVNTSEVLVPNYKFLFTLVAGYGLPSYTWIFKKDARSVFLTH